MTLQTASRSHSRSCYLQNLPAIDVRAFDTVLIDSTSAHSSFAWRPSPIGPQSSDGMPSAAKRAQSVQYGSGEMVGVVPIAAPTSSQTRRQNAPSRELSKAGLDAVALTSNSKSSTPALMFSKSSRISFSTEDAVSPTSVRRSSVMRQLAGYDEASSPPSINEACMVGGPTSESGRDVRSR
jgi:hypothetical protein